MASGVVGSLLVKLAAATADFDSSMKSSAEKIGKTKHETDELAKSMKDIGHIGAGVAIGEFMVKGAEKLAEFAKESVHYLFELAERMDAAEEAADKLGVSVDSFLILDRLAQKSATSIDAVGTAINRMKRSIAEGKGIGDLGFTTEQLEGMAPEKAFEKLAEKISKVTNPMERARLEAEIFGKSGAELDGVIRKLGGGFEKLKDSVGDEDAISALERFGDSYEVLMHKLEVGSINILGKVVRGWEFAVEQAKNFGSELGGSNPIPLAGMSVGTTGFDEQIKADQLKHAAKINEELQKQKDLLAGIGKTKEEQDRIRFISENSPTKKELADYDAIHSKIMEQTEAIKEKKRVGEDWDKIITEELKSADRLSEKMKTFGEKLRDMDPLQKFKEQMKEIDDWLKYLGDDVTDAQRKAASEAVKQMRKDAVDGMAKNAPEMEPFKAFSNAAMAGTAEAQNTILRARYGTADNSKIQKQIDLAVEQVGLLKSLPEIARDIKPQVVPL